MSESEYRLLTVSQVADWLQVKPTTIYQWVYEGSIPVIKVGSLNRFSYVEIREWLEKRRSGRQPNSASGGDAS